MKLGRRELLEANDQKFVNEGRINAYRGRWREMEREDTF